ncbi:MAG: dihydrofolate reductase [Verrucomicrobiota bacterium]
MTTPRSTKLQAVVAMASNRVIGRDGSLPWSLPEDLKWFKKLTVGDPIVMGRKTMESIGRPLPKRRNLVVSRSLREAPDGFEVFSSCEDALEALSAEEKASVIGGAQIYAEMMPLCDEVWLSFVFEPHEGDTSLHPFEHDFEMIETVHRDSDFELRRYRRKS